VDRQEFMKLHKKLDEAQKQLESIEEQSFDHLDFEWEGISFQAASTAETAGNASIHLKATLGRLYFTVEDEAQRAMALERLFTNNRVIDGLYKIDKKGDIHFSNTTKTESHLTGSKFMSALTVILLEAEKHLRALRTHLKAI
jgi:hypothetical protein